MLKLEMRPQLSRFWTFGSPILALLITVLIGTSSLQASTPLTVTLAQQIGTH
jgi:simple sugar transport system permease protein